MEIDVPSVKVLDHGHTQIKEVWGSDKRIIEAARQSTGKGFLGWDPGPCSECDGSGVIHPNLDEDIEVCSVCEGEGALKGDMRLLAYLYKNWHETPFEMAGMIIEIKAPIMVFREWHRHRTQSYNEMSARYVPLPNENYMPELENVLNRARLAAQSANKQARGKTSKIPTESQVFDWLLWLDGYYQEGQRGYEKGIDIGIPKELARLPVTVGRYSKMWTQANLRNWLAFLTLRKSIKAQWEIRQYADQVGCCVQEYFPRTYGLFLEGR